MEGRKGIQQPRFKGQEKKKRVIKYRFRKLMEGRKGRQEPRFKGQETRNEL
jgi:hypothetical protein